MYVMDWTIGLLFQTISFEPSSDFKFLSDISIGGQRSVYPAFITCAWLLESQPPIIAVCCQRLSDFCQIIPYHMGDGSRIPLTTYAQGCYNCMYKIYLVTFVIRGGTQKVRGGKSQQPWCFPYKQS